MGSATFPCADCGDDIRVSGGNNRQCASQAAYRKKRGDVCFECEKARAATNAATYSEEHELPALEGTEKQIAYAEVLRARKLRWLRNDFEDVRARASRGEKSQAVCSDAADLAAPITSAKWWIECQGDTPEQIIEALTPSVVDALAEEADEDIVVRPVEMSTDTVCEVRATDKRLTARMPERHEAFNERVKALGYRWDRAARCWTLALGPTTGDTADRVVELAHAALAAGVPARVADVTLHARIVAGDYAPRTHLWVCLLVESNRLLVTMPYGHEAFDAARSLPGARYNKDLGGITVPPTSAAPMLDFADEHGFRLTPGAQEAVDDAMAALRNAEVVEARERHATPDAPTDRTATGEIDDELRDGE